MQIDSKTYDEIYASLEKAANLLGMTLVKKEVPEEVSNDRAIREYNSE